MTVTAAAVTPGLAEAIDRLLERRPEVFSTEQTQRSEAQFHTQLYADYGAGPERIAWLGDAGQVLTCDGDAWNTLTLLFEIEGWSWSLSGRTYGSRAVGLFDANAENITTVLHDHDLTAAALLAFDEALTIAAQKAVNA